MVNSKKVKWQKTFNRLSMEHFNDQMQAKRLIARIHWLLIKNMQFKFDIAKDGQKYADKLGMMEKLRSWISDYLIQYKKKMTEEKKSRLLRIKKRLPIDTLADRIKLMEITEQYKYEVPEDIHGKWNSKGLLRMIDKLEGNTRKLKSIDEKMMFLISDIHDLYSYIAYVRRASMSKSKMIALLKGINTNVGKFRRNIPVLMPSRKPLESLPNFLPDMYHYLET